MMMKKPFFPLLIASAIALAACGEEKAAAPDTPAKSESSAATAPQAASGAAKVNSDLLERINNKGTITVVTEGSYPPFTYHDEKTKELTGYDIEVVRAIGAKLGVKVDFKELKWVGIFPSLEKGEYDFAANQITLSSPERQAVFDKAEPYSWSGVGIITRIDDDRIKKYEDIAGLRAAQNLTSSYGERATKAGASVRPSETLTQSVNLVKLKEVDFTMNDSLAALNRVHFGDNDKALKVAWTTPNEEKKGAGLVMLKGNPEVLTKVNEAMKALKDDGTLKKLGEQFFGEDVSIKPANVK